MREKNLHGVPKIEVIIDFGLRLFLYLKNLMKTESDSKALRAIFVFDDNYLSAAFVSVLSFLEALKDFGIGVTMIYYADASRCDTGLSREALSEFKEKSIPVFGHDALNIIEINGNIFDGHVKRHHFNSTILYKIVIPKVVGLYRHIIVFDCGLIFGIYLKKFISAVRTQIEDKTISTVAAFCLKSAEVKNSSALLQGKSTNALYPAGVILYFDVQKYDEIKLYERFLACFFDYREELIYAEQEILCLTLKEGELGQLAECGMRYHMDLATSDWCQASDDVKFYSSKQYLYVKHVGSFKPWKKWVLHPSKAIFLWEKVKVIDTLKFERYDTLDDSEIVPARIDFLEHQLRRLEIIYSAKQLLKF